MECGICLEDNLHNELLHYMECKHFTCNSCYRKLKKNTCPFCRKVIKLFSKPNTNKNIINFERSANNAEYFIFSNDFVIPTMRLDRNEYRLKKKLNKKKKLEKFLNENKIENDYYIYIPNKKYRINKKLKKIKN